MKRFALAGNPNCGKTTLFNALTGSTAHVGNWPGVTVDKKEGTYKKCKEPIAIVDLPGIYSLSPYTPEEVISRNFIIDEKPDCVINIVDATNLERNLYLTTQLLEMDVPIVIALNMMDVVEKNGDIIDCTILEKEIGVPVVPISAQRSTGIDTLMDKAYNECEKIRLGKSVLEDSSLAHLVKDVKTAFKGLNIANPLFHAIKLIENDEIEVKNHPNLVNIVDEFKQSFKDATFGSDLEAIVADERYQYITKNYTKCRTKFHRINQSEQTLSDKIDRVLTHKWFGLPIFLLILFLVFHLTFSENLFYLGALFSNVTPSFEGTMFEGLIWTNGGINSPGVMLFNLVDCLTSSLGDVIAGWLSSSPSWISGLICDGVCAGVFGVLSFVPQILLLFLLFSILEDSGYMARVAFILDRLFRKFGLSGRAFMPMIMGFGCSVPAMINTRTLADENERTATVRVIPFFSCGAKLPILTAIAGGICELFKFPNADIITYSMYVIGMVTAIIAVILMRNTTMRGAVPPFIMELPTYHLPQFKALMIHLWDKLKHYIEKAFTIILASTIVIWFLQSFTFNWKYIEQADPISIADEAYASLIEDLEYRNIINNLDSSYIDDNGDVIVKLSELVLAYSDANDASEIAKYEEALEPVFSKAIIDYQAIVNDPNYIDTSDSILAGLGQLITPIFTPLGFGSQLNENGWMFGVSALTGLIAKENVVATFSVLSQCIASNQNVTEDSYINLYMLGIDEDGVSATVQAIENTGINIGGGFKGWSILISFIVFNMTTIPCFASIATARGELTKKKFRNTIIFWLVASYAASSIVYCVLSAWWTAFIILPFMIAIGIGIHYYNKYNDTKKVANI
ncbi:MAG: ferrous iron transport protein B [Anaeroplasma sp.]